MQVSLEVQYSIGDILVELGGNTSFDSATGIIPVKMGDKLFIGGGCELSKVGDSGAHPASPQNISICVSGPML